MNSPRRRVWLYVPDTDPDKLEVTVMGMLDEIGLVVAVIKTAAERWRGFERVEIVGAGSNAGILRMALSTYARTIDPIAEFLGMWSACGNAENFIGARIDWSAAGPAGMVGTW